MTKHTPREMKVSDRSLWGDTPCHPHVRMARIIEHSPMNGMDADHLANELAKRWNCHDELLAELDNALALAGTDSPLWNGARAAIAKAKGLAA